MTGLAEAVADPVDVDGMEVVGNDQVWVVPLWATSEVLQWAETSAAHQWVVTLAAHQTTDGTTKVTSGVLKITNNKVVGNQPHLPKVSNQAVGVAKLNLHHNRVVGDNRTLEAIQVGMLKQTTLGLAKDS